MLTAQTGLSKTKCTKGDFLFPLSDKSKTFEKKQSNYSSIYPSISVLFIPFGLAGGGACPGRPPFIFTLIPKGNVAVTNQSNVSVFGPWEEAGVPQKSTRMYMENIQTLHRLALTNTGIKPATFLLGGTHTT